LDIEEIKKKRELEENLRWEKSLREGATPTYSNKAPSTSLPEPEPTTIKQPENSRCTQCDTPRKSDATFCAECGYIFPKLTSSAPSVTPVTSTPTFKPTPVFSSRTNPVPTKAPSEGPKPNSSRSTAPATIGQATKFKCGKCNADWPSGKVFCPSCGAPNRVAVSASSTSASTSASTSTSTSTSTTTQISSLEPISSTLPDPTPAPVTSPPTKLTSCPECGTSRLPLTAPFCPECGYRY